MATDNTGVKDTKTLEKLFATPTEIHVGDYIFKVMPATLAELPIIQKKLDAYETASLSAGLTEDTIMLMAEVIGFGLKKYHPEITAEFIAKNFPILVFPDFISAITQIDAFLAKMRKMSGNAFLPH